MRALGSLRDCKATLMVGVRGFEPPAPASRRQCSTRLSYTPIPWTAPLSDPLQGPPRRGVGGYIPARPAPRKRRIPRLMDFLAPPADLRSELPVDHEIDHIQQRRLLLPIGEKPQGVTSDGSVMPRPLHGVPQRAMLVH